MSIIAREHASEILPIIGRPDFYHPTAPQRDTVISACKTKLFHTIGVELNTASAQELAQLCGLGPDRVARVVQAKPLRPGDDVDRLEGSGRPCCAICSVPAYA